MDIEVVSSIPPAFRARSAYAELGSAIVALKDGDALKVKIGTAPHEDRKIRSYARYFAISKGIKISTKSPGDGYIYIMKVL